MPLAIHYRGVTRNAKEIRGFRLHLLREPLTATLTVPFAFAGPGAWELAWLAVVPIGFILNRLERRNPPAG